MPATSSASLLRLLGSAALAALLSTSAALADELPTSPSHPMPGPGGTSPAAETPSSDEELPEFGQYVYVEQLPEAITKIAALYPDSLRARHVEGLVMVQALVGKDGRVKDTRIVQSVAGLDEFAEFAVKQWIFKPAMTNQKPVAVWVAVPVSFRLHGPAPPARDSLLAALNLSVVELQSLGHRPPPEPEQKLRDHIIWLAQQISPAPLILDLARHAFERGEARLLNAGTTADFESLAEDFAEALRLAPWWMEAYREQATALEKAGRYGPAIRSLRFCLRATSNAEAKQQIEARIQSLENQVLDTH